MSEKEFKITGVPKTLKHGVKYTVTLTNKGKFPHDMLFDGKKVSRRRRAQQARRRARARARRSRSRSRQAGTYRFYCAIKGHAAKGMQGKVKVT